MSALIALLALSAVPVLAFGLLLALQLVTCPLPRWAPWWLEDKPARHDVVYGLSTFMPTQAVRLTTTDMVCSAALNLLLDPICWVSAR